MKENSPYLFPPNLRADKESLEGQLGYVILEAEEAYDAFINGEGDDRVIEELWDTIQTAEGGLRKFPLWKVLVGLAKVKIKCLKRGDYGAAK